MRNVEGRSVKESTSETNIDYVKYEENHRDSFTNGRILTKMPRKIKKKRPPTSSRKGKPKKNTLKWLSWNTSEVKTSRLFRITLSVNQYPLRCSRGKIN